MTVIWSGVTEEGAVVPVQVTAEGKVVAVGDGPQGDYLPTTGGNLTGDLTLGTDKITLDAADGSATFTGNIDTYDYGSDAADQGADRGEAPGASGPGDGEDAAEHGLERRITRAMGEYAAPIPDPAAHDQGHILKGVRRQGVP